MGCGSGSLADMMKTKGLHVPIAFCLLAVLGFGFAQEPSSSFKIGYVNSEYLLSLHAVYPEVIALQEQAKEDISTLNQRVQELVEKSQSATGLTADEQDVLNVSIITLESLSQRYENEIRELAQPALEAVTGAVAETARALGLAMVFDYRLASESGLIVYADPETDITPRVAELLAGGE